MLNQASSRLATGVSTAPSEAAGPKPLQALAPEREQIPRPKEFCDLLTSPAAHIALLIRNEAVPSLRFGAQTFLCTFYRQSELLSLPDAAQLILVLLCRI